MDIKGSRTHKKLEIFFYIFIFDKSIYLMQGTHVNPFSEPFHSSMKIFFKNPRTLFTCYFIRITYRYMPIYQRFQNVLDVAKENKPYHQIPEIKFIWFIWNTKVNLCCDRDLTALYNCISKISVKHEQFKHNNF